MQKSVYLVLAVLLALPLASASIAIDPLLAVYNVGDELTISFTVTRAASAHGFLTADLACAEGRYEIYKTPLRTSAGEQKKINIPARLDRFLIGNASTACSILIAYGGETAKSTTFEISSEAFIVASMAESVVQPGGSALVGGRVTKKNGKPLEGIIDAALTELNITYAAPVTRGAFNLTLPVPGNARAHTYVVTLRASERDSDGLESTKGQTTLSFKVPQILVSSEIALDRLTLAPAEMLSYRVLAFDQAEELMVLTSKVTLRSPSGAVSESEVYTGVLHDVPFLWNATPGTWTLEARVGPLKSSKDIVMLAVRNVSMVLENDTLLIRNVGNTEFSETIQVMIGSDPRDVPVTLAVGESVRLKLFAPRGSHAIAVSSGNETTAFGGVYLTGKSVDVRNADSRTWSVDPWMWWFLLILGAASAAVYYYRKYGRHASWGRTPHRDWGREDTPSRTVNTAPARALTTASNVGTKEECAIVAVHVKNLGHLGQTDSPTAATIARVQDQGKNARAAVYTQGTHLVMILSPSSVGNTGQASVSLARDIDRILRDHNKQYAYKISFGIGINKGMMIVERSGGKPKFTSIGTTVLSAKRLAEHAREGILVGDELYRSMIGKIKVEKVGEKRWKLKEGGTVSRNAEFLKRFYEERH